MVETKTFQELELVELLEDLPEYDLKKGEIGVVVEVFETPSEAYDLEFVDESGRSSRFAYSVRPDQIKASEERKRKANLFDVVEVAEDLPEYGAKRGEHGVVVEVFDDPDEGYILEFGDRSGTSSRLAYWVKPEQFKRVTPRKAQELEVVELTEDIPEYGVKKGERGVVITAFTKPDEAYDLEFVDESGSESRFAYSVKPNQIRTQAEIANKAYKAGRTLVAEGNSSEAESKFREAVALSPGYIGKLHNDLIRSLSDSADWPRHIWAMRFVLRIDSNYELARYNLAIAYLKFGVEQASQKNFRFAGEIFLKAIAVQPNPDSGFEELIQTNLAGIHTSLGIQAYEEGRLEQTVADMLRACAYRPGEATRRHVGLAYALLAVSDVDANKLEKAIQEFELAEDAGFIAPESVNDYGVALARVGRTAEAVAAFERALMLAPGDEVLRANLCLAEAQQAVPLILSVIAAKFEPAHSVDPASGADREIMLAA